MPLPSKEPKESKQAFVSRCLSDEKTKKEFPSKSQRMAVCMSRATLDMNTLEAADFTYNFNTYGYEEEISEDNFYVPAETEYEDFGEVTEQWDISEAKPGLWENIRKKKEREGKKYRPAKPGDPDRPDKEAWKKAQSRTYRYRDPMSGEVYIFNRPGPHKKDGRYLIKAAEYQGKKVTLNKPFRTPDGPKKFAVYTKNDKGKVVIVRFGDPNMKIKKNIPERRKSFRARHNCDNPGPKWKARYWSCKAW
jgi:hypothetical protein